MQGRDPFLWHPAVPAEDRAAAVASLRDEVRRARVVDASDVFAGLAAGPYKAADWTDGSRDCRLPFDTVAIEFATPTAWHDSWVTPYRPEGARSGVVAVQGLRPTEPGLESLPAGVSCIRAACLESAPGDRVVHLCDLYVALDAEGCPVEAPQLLLGPAQRAMLDELRGSIRDEGLSCTPEDFLRVRMIGFVHPLFAATTLLNCRNVSLDEHPPDPAVNRERRKAGLAPFLAYHTIVVEAERRAKRAGDPGEPAGTKMPLHRVRGHTAVYRTSFMGRPLDAPVRYYRPNHIKGDPANGIRIAGYRIQL
jgi:hypothetical protein